MDDIFLHLSNTIEQSLNASLETFLKVSCMYKEELSTLPFSIDILSEALRSQNLRETAHCKILYKLLQNRKILTNFIQHFLPSVEDYSRDSIQLPYPDRHRIDLTIKSNKFFLIIENKVNGACEQNGQIDRYVQIAQTTYPHHQIYVLYLGGDTNIHPSEYSMSRATERLLDSRIIYKNYKHDIIPWISSIYKLIAFEDQPFLKSSLLTYKTYLENKYNTNNLNKEMNNKLKRTLIKTLELETRPLAEKISILQDQIDNMDTIRERLVDLLQDYKEQRIELDIKDWYNQLSNTRSFHPILTMDDSTEFGFNFKYRNTDFRCCVSFDDSEDPYWGIKGLTETINSRPKVFETLKKMILESNKGFHNYEANADEWVVSDYEKREYIVERFIDLTKLIYKSKDCSIIE